MGYKIMKPMLKTEFSAELVKEYSYTPERKSLGVQKCSMELWNDTATLQDGWGTIEWIIGLDTDSEDVGANIGVWWNKSHVLTDYDGVFQLPKEAIVLIEKAGIHVPDEFKQ